MRSIPYVLMLLVPIINSATPPTRPALLRNPRPPSVETMARGQQKCNQIRDHIKQGACPDLADAIYKPLGFRDTLDCPQPPPSIASTTFTRCGLLLMSAGPITMNDTRPDESCMLLWNKTDTNSLCMSSFWAVDDTWGSRHNSSVPTTHMGLGIRVDTPENTFASDSDYVIPTMIARSSPLMDEFPAPPAEMQLTYPMVIAFKSAPKKDFFVDINLLITHLSEPSTGCMKRGTDDTIPSVFYYDATSRAWRAIREHVRMYKENFRSLQNVTSIRAKIPLQVVAKNMPLLFLAVMPVSIKSAVSRTTGGVGQQGAWDVLPTMIVSTAVANVMEYLLQMVEQRSRNVSFFTCRRPVSENARQVILLGSMKKKVMGSPVVIELSEMPPLNDTIVVELPVVYDAEETGNNTDSSLPNATRRRSLLQSGEPPQMQTPFFFNNGSGEWQSIAENCTYNDTMQANECMLGGLFFRQYGLDIMFANLADNLTSSNVPIMAVTTRTTTPSPNSEGLSTWVASLIGALVFALILCLVVRCWIKSCRKVVDVVTTVKQKQTVDGKTNTLNPGSKMYQAIPTLEAPADVRTFILQSELGRKHGPVKYC